MADIRDYKRLNPFDLNQNVRIGVVFPFDASGVFRSSNTTAEQVKSNIIHVLKMCDAFSLNKIKSVKVPPMSIASLVII